MFKFHSISKKKVCLIFLVTLLSSQACEAAQAADVGTSTQESASVSIPASRAKALMEAVCAGKEEDTRVLLAENAQVDVQDEHNNTPFIIAASKGFMGILRMLHEASADVGAVNKNRANALNVAAANGRLDVVEFLTTIEVDRENRDNWGITPLMDAALYNKVDVVRWLATTGSNTNPLGTYHISAVTAIGACPGILPTAWLEGVSPLMMACLLGHADVVDVLVENRAEVNATSGESTIMDHSCRWNFFDYSREWTRAEKRDPTLYKRWTPLLFAMFGASQSLKAAGPTYRTIVQRLIAAGAMIDAVTMRDETALMSAANMGNVGMVQDLLAAGADVSRVDTSRRSAAYYSLKQTYRLRKATETIDLETIRLLCEGIRGTSALIRSTLAEDLEQIDLFLRAGIAPNGVDEHGKTPLMYARTPGIIDAMIKARANVFAVDRDSRTALHYVIDLLSSQTVTDPKAFETLDSALLLLKSMGVALPSLSATAYTSSWMPGLVKGTIKDTLWNRLRQELGAFITAYRVPATAGAAGDAVANVVIGASLLPAAGAAGGAGAAGLIDVSPLLA